MAAGGHYKAAMAASTKVLVADSFPPSGIEALEGLGVAVSHQPKLAAAELAGAIADPVMS